MSKVSKKRQGFKYRALSTEVKIKIAPLESTKTVLVVFGCALPANLFKVN